MRSTQALPIARAAYAALKPHCQRIEIAGSIRRKRQDVHDIEFVLIPATHVVKEESPDLFEANEVQRVERTPGFIAAANSLGGCMKGKIETGRLVQYLHADGIAIELYITAPERWGNIFAVRTGSADFSKALATRWVQLGYKGIEGVLHKGDKPVALREEEDFFALLRMRMPPPERRELGAEGLKPWLIY